MAMQDTIELVEVLSRPGAFTHDENSDVSVNLAPIRQAERRMLERRNEFHVVRSQITGVDEESHLATGFHFLHICVFSADFALC